MSSPTVLFVHGSWHTPAHFAPVREVFEKAGFPTSCPRHPSVGKLPPIGFEEDSQCIFDELVTLVDKEARDVIVVGHSYGGVVATQAVKQRFAKKVRAEEGKKGGVLRILYICAFMVKDGQSLADPFGGTLPPFITIDVSCSYLEGLLKLCYIFTQRQLTALHRIKI